MTTDSKRRDVKLKPREEGTLPASKLQDILRIIYPEETVQEVLRAIGFSVDGENNAEDDSNCRKGNIRK